MSHLCLYSRGGGQRSKYFFSNGKADFLCGDIHFLKYTAPQFHCADALVNDRQLLWEIEVVVTSVDNLAILPGNVQMVVTVEVEVSEVSISSVVLFYEKADFFVWIRYSLS